MIYDYEYFWSTRRVIGRGCVKKVGEKIKADGAHRVLLHYGRGKYLDNILPELRSSLDAAGLEYVELGGVVPNPRVELVREGVRILRNENIDYIVAVGGGSATDSAKAISVGAINDVDVWELFNHSGVKVNYEGATPIASVVTYPATGAEAGWATVVRNPEVLEKWSIWDQPLRPHFAFMDPEYTLTLPRNLLVNGICDIMSHHTDRYMSDDAHFGVFDNLLESAMHYLHKDLAPTILDPEKDNIADRTELMAIADMGVDEFIAWGRHKENASHNIAHQIGALYDTLHGSTLSIIYCSWLTYVMDENLERVARWANRVWEVDYDPSDLKGTALKGVAKLKEWYTWLGMPVCFSDIGLHPSAEEIERMAELAIKNSNTDYIGVMKKLYKEDVAEILRNCL